MPTYGEGTYGGGTYGGEEVVSETGWVVHLIDRTNLVLDTLGVATAGFISLADIDDGDLGPLTTAVVEDYGFKRNGIGEANVTFHVTDALASTDLRLGTNDLLSRELWIFEDGTLRFMGVPGPWAADLDSQSVKMRLREPTEYLRGKVFGRADRENKVANGGFEDDPSDIAPWTEQDPDTVATFSVDGTFANEDDQSLKIVGSASGAYASQVLTDNVDHEFVPALNATFAAWCYVDSDFTDTPEGTVLASLVATAAVPGSPYTNAYEVDSTFQFNQWVRIETDLQLAAFIDWTVEVRLSSVNGTIWWDSVQVAYPDSTTMLLGDDIGVLIGNVVEYSQSPSVGQSSEVIDHDVTTLGIVPPGPRGFAHNLHENIWTAGLMAIATEFQIDIWLGLDRIIHAAVHRGTSRTGLAIDITITDDEYDITVGADADAAVATDVAGDPSQERSSVIVMGEGRSFAREEVGRVDTSNFGGLVKTVVATAEASATVRSMGDQADALLAEGKQPAALPSVTYKINDLDDCPDPGDTIPATINFGCVQFDADLRVEAVKVVPLTNAVVVSFDEDWAA